MLTHPGGIDRDMSDERPRLSPGPDHPITVQPHDGKVVVRVGEATIAASERAIELHEADYPAVLYLPLEDVDPGVLLDSDRHTYCPYKGQASYYDIDLGEQGRLDAAIWYYAEPYDAVSAIAGRVAFYPDRVTIIR